VHEPDDADITLNGDAAAAAEDGPGSVKLNVGDGEPSQLISLDEDDNVIVEGVPGRNTMSEQHACATLAGNDDGLEYDMFIPDVSGFLDDEKSSVDGDVLDSEGLVHDSTCFTHLSSGLHAEETDFVSCDTEDDTALASLGSGEDGVDSSEYSDTSDDDEETPARFASSPLRLRFSCISRILHFRGTISLRKARTSLVCTNSETCLYSSVLALLLCLYAS
jgi:hypothetical protein